MVKTRRKRKTRCRCAKSRCTCRHGGRRSHRGGGHPLAATAGTFPALPFAPPGGMYKPGAVNGLDGGYYYGVNVDQCKVRIYYDDNRRKGRSWDVELKNNMFIMFPSTLLYCISNKQKEKLNFILTTTYEYI